VVWGFASQQLCVAGVIFVCSLWGKSGIRLDYAFSQSPFGGKTIFVHSPNAASKRVKVKISAGVGLGKKRSIQHDAGYIIPFLSAARTRVKVKLSPLFCVCPVKLKIGRALLRAALNCYYRWRCRRLPPRAGWPEASLL